MRYYFEFKEIKGNFERVRIKKERKSCEEIGNN